MKTLRTFCFLVVLAVTALGENYQYTFIIEDACSGKALAGVLVSVSGGTCTTGSRGSCKITLPKHTRSAITTSKEGYTTKTWPEDLLSLKGNISGMVPSHLRLCGERK